MQILIICIEVPSCPLIARCVHQNSDEDHSSDKHSIIKQNDCQHFLQVHAVNLHNQIFKIINSIACEQDCKRYGCADKGNQDLFRNIVSAKICVDLLVPDTVLLLIGCHSCHSPDTSFINGNYALEAGLNVATDALATESAEGDAIQQYVNVIAVKEGNESSAKIKALTDALHSETAVKYINDNYQGAVVPYDGE